MKTRILFALLVLISLFGFSQNSKPIFLDFNRDTITFEQFYAYTITGEYKAKYHKEAKVRSLIPYREGELKIELAKTKEKTVITEKLGTNFPAINVKDINEKVFSTNLSKGKVIVVNFWFIGCVPCEFERKALNAIYNEYKGNPDVVFISIAKSKKVQLEKYLVKRPFLYPIAELNEQLINLLEVHSYPQNQIIGKDGKYFFNSHSVSAGSGIILKEAIDKALASQ